jgi:hypothetical protein
MFPRQFSERLSCTAAAQVPAHAGGMIAYRTSNSILA